MKKNELAVALFALSIVDMAELAGLNEMELVSAMLAVSEGLDRVRKMKQDAEKLEKLN